MGLMDEVRACQKTKEQYERECFEEAERKKEEEFKKALESMYKSTALSVKSAAATGKRCCFIVNPITEDGAKYDQKTWLRIYKSIKKQLENEGFEVNILLNTNGRYSDITISW